MTVRGEDNHVADDFPLEDIAELLAEGNIRALLEDWPDRVTEQRRRLMLIAAWTASRVVSIEKRLTDMEARGTQEGRRLWALAIVGLVLGAYAAVSVLGGDHGTALLVAGISGALGALVRLSLS